MDKTPLRVVATGDLAFNGGYARLLDRLGPLGPFRAVLPAWEGAHLRLGNLESPLAATSPKAEPSKLTLRSASRAAEALRLARFDCVSLANNHAMDYGPGGLAETIEKLEAAGVAHHGAGRDRSESRAPLILRREGRSIGMLAYCEVSRSNPTTCASEGRPGVAAFDVEGCCDGIRALRSEVDWVVVQVHWGQEMAHLPSPEQRAWARRMVEAGADLILGHHPHILQPYERIDGVPVFYSLGNFAFSEMYWRGRNERGEPFSSRLRIHPRSRATGWAGVLLREGAAAEVRLHPARLRRDLTVAPDDTPRRRHDWEALCRRLEAADYAAESGEESRAAEARRRWMYRDRTLARRIGLRLFHHGLIPHAVEGT